MATIYTTKNKYGCVIVKCCASCIHNTGPDKKERYRICNAGEGSVLLSSYCSLWEMKRKPEKNAHLGQVDLDAAGKGDGKVKKKKYLDFLQNYQQPNDPFQHASLDVIRAEYEHRYGSIYIKNF